MKNYRVFTTVLILVALTGCAVKPKADQDFIRVDSLTDFDFIVNPDAMDEPISVALPPGKFADHVSEEHKQIAELLRKYVEESLKRCPSRYRVIDGENWRSADVAIDVVLVYMGIERVKAYSRAVSPLSLGLAAQKPTQKAVQPFVSKMMGGSVSAGAASSVAAGLGLVYDISQIIRSIGKLYGKCAFGILDQRPGRIGQKKIMFHTFMATTIELDQDDEFRDKKKFVLEFGDGVLGALNYYSCPLVSQIGGASDEMPSPN